MHRGLAGTGWRAHRPITTAVMVAITFVAACGEPQPVAIGIALGRTDSDGARFAYEDAVRGGLEIAIDTIFLQGANDNRAAPAIEAAQALATQPGLVAVVGHSNSAASLAAAPIYNEHEVVQISPQSTAVLYSNAGPFSFRMVSPDDRQGRFLGLHLMDEARGRQVALLYVNDDYGRGLRSEVLRAVAPGAIEWVMDAPHVERSDSAAVRLLVEQLVAARPDLIVWLGRYFELDRYLAGIRATLGDVQIIAGDGVSAALTLAGNDPLWTGVQYVELVNLDGTPQIREFRARYKQRFGREPLGAEVLAYDAMALLIEAIEAGSHTGRAVQQYLDALGRERPAFPGIAGPVMFDSVGDVLREYYLREINSPAR